MALAQPEAPPDPVTVSPEACTPQASAENGCARLRIPAAEVDSAITHFPLKRTSWQISAWEREVGHLERTDWFGGGHTVLGGHSLFPNTRHNVFRHLGEVQPGDEIIVMLGTAELRYEVREVFEAGSQDAHLLDQRLTNRLTLITCDVLTRDPATGDFAGRVVVIAERIG